MVAQPFRRDEQDRAEPRDQVYHRSRATLADQRTVSVTIVNLSPHGLMARVETDIAVGETLKVRLPIVGVVDAVVRWSLGGRIGCQLARPIDLRQYAPLLAASA